jgi:hypothetical protein
MGDLNLASKGQNGSIKLMSSVYDYIFGNFFSSIGLVTDIKMYVGGR